MAHYFIGLDAGSSVCKAAIFDKQGRQLAEAARRMIINRPYPGWSELDPQNCWRIVLEVIKEAVAMSGVKKHEFSGIGLTAAMVGAWAVNENGEALRPGILWEDSRATPLIEAMLKQAPDILARIFRSSGSALQQGCTLPLLAWLANHEPNLLAQCRYILSYKDFLRLKLTGKVATDRSEAAVLPGSAIKRDRSEEMIALFGLNKWCHLLPPIHESESFIGTLTEEVARLLDLPASLPVAIGAGDVPSTLIGVGALLPGATVAVLGTTAMIGICHERPVFEPPDIGLLFSLPGALWYRAMVNVAGTLNLDWALETLAPDLAEEPDHYDQITALARAVPAGADGLTYLPYLSESGIIAPRLAPQARAQFCALTPRHGRGAMFRAVFEGVAFSLKDLLDKLNFHEHGADNTPIILTGGGGRNPFWMQMMADVLEHPIYIPDPIQFGARGAALLAATAAGEFVSIVQASQATNSRKTGKIYQPQPVNKTHYDQAYARYETYRDRLLS